MFCLEYRQLVHFTLRAFSLHVFSESGLIHRNESVAKEALSYFLVPHFEIAYLEIIRSYFGLLAIL